MEQGEHRLQKKVSAWRLANVALGGSALLNALTIGTSIVPSRWLMAPFFTVSSMQEVPPMTAFIARIGINLWVPASILMVLFCLLGFHRKVDVPSKRWASVLLAVSWICHIALTSVSYLIPRGEAFGAIMFLVGMVVMPIAMPVFAASAFAIVVELKTLFRHREKSAPYLPVGVLACALIPPAYSIGQLVMAPSRPLAQSAKETSDFRELCKGVGVQFMDKPAGPVRSIFYDGNMKSGVSERGVLQRIEIDSDGRVTGYGGFPSPRSEERRKKLDLDFTERRRELSGAGAATVNPSAPYYHFPDFRTRQPYYGVEEISADLLAFLDIDNPGAPEAAMKQGAVRYKLTLTDRRSGAILGVQTYVVDWTNKRACGANIESTISQEAFIYDAIHR